LYVTYVVLDFFFFEFGNKTSSFLMYILISPHRVYTAHREMTKNLNFFSMLHAVKTDKESLMKIVNMSLLSVMCDQTVV